MNKKETSKRGKGRPRQGMWLTGNWKKKILDMMAEGASKVEVMAEFDLCSDTFYNWLRYWNEDKDLEYKDFADTIKKGEKLCETWWEKQGRKNLENGKFNATLWYMNMKNRFKWADKVQQEHSGPDGKELGVIVLPALEKE